MFRPPVAANWKFTLDGQEHEVVCRYHTTTGECSLTLNGEQVKHWPGGWTQGSRFAASHGFSVGNHEIAFEAGFVRLASSFKLKVDGVEVPKAGGLLQNDALMTVVAVVGALLVFILFKVYGG